VEERKIGDDKMTFIQGCKDPKSLAILIRAALERLVDEAAEAVTGKPINLTEESVRKSLDPEESVKSKILIGGTSPQMVEKAIKATREKISKDEEWITIKRHELQQSRKNLMKRLTA
jgi:chaperonin GroEL (HSP60 family)